MGTNVTHKDQLESSTLHDDTLEYVPVQIMAKDGAQNDCKLDPNEYLQQQTMNSTVGPPVLQ